jgi:alpha-mannosidase
LVDVQVEEEGPLRATLRLQWCFYDSIITQRISIYRHSRRIDFRTEVDWHEQQILLKAAFPVDIRATRATYDIQFGSVERATHWNTSWDYARFEVCAHKWADLSEGNYGVALLNDCKYGYDIKGNVMRLTLLKSAIRPDAQADKGHHSFTYSLLPHAETWDKSDVIQEAYDLNNPLSGVVIPAQPHNHVPAAYSFVTSNTPNVIIETVKKAEDNDGWVVRVYESRQYRNPEVSLAFGKPVRRAVECNLVEEAETPFGFDENRLTFAIAPYEVKTFKIWF